MRKIKVELGDEPREEGSARQQVLSNRGIGIEDQDRGLAASLDELYDGRLLGEDNIKQIVEDIVDCIKNDSQVILNVDPDQDGLAAASLLYNYFYVRFPTGTSEYCGGIMHEGKQHGLADIMDDIAAFDNVGVVLCADSSSNDIKEMKELAASNIYVDILD